MRIAVDARELAPHPTGVGRYLLEILLAWAQDSGGRGLRRHALRADRPRSGVAAPRTAPARACDRASCPAAAARRGNRLRLPLRAAARAPTSSSRPPIPRRSSPRRRPSSPSTTCRSAPTRNGSGAREGLRRRWTCRLAARQRARTVLTVSAFSRTRSSAGSASPPARVRVTPLGVERPGPAAGGAGATATTRAPLVLSVGTHAQSPAPARSRPRLRAAGRAPTRGARLVIVGENRTHPARRIPRAVARDLGLGRGGRAAAVDLRRRADRALRRRPPRSRSCRPTKASA